MRRDSTRPRLAALALWSAGAAAQPASAEDFSAVQPILAARCVMCHASESAPLGLRLDSYEGVTKGSSNGPVVEAGNPSGSELVKRLKGESLPRMPMTGPPFLAPDEIAVFERWIAGGAKPASGGAARAPAAAPASASAPAPATSGPPTWAAVAPIFATRCAKCHTATGVMGPAPEGYLLTGYEQALDATDRARIVPGRPDASELVRRIRGQARPRMPFDGPPYLSDAEIRLITDWIAQGARDASGTPAELPAGAKVRLHGRLTGRWQLDGLPLDVNGDTRYDKGPAPGDYVEVRGTIEAGGEVRAERVRPR
jgi:mono/diheme cytochrome c family protein